VVHVIAESVSCIVCLSSNQLENWQQSIRGAFPVENCSCSSSSWGCI